MRLGKSGDTALDRALAILDLLATTDGVTVSSIATSLGLSRSTTYRLIDRLREKGYVDASNDEGLWRLGHAAARLALAAADSMAVAKAAPEFLRILVQQTRESIGLAIPSGEDMMFIYRDRGPQSISVNAGIGARRPMYCTSLGKAYLAALPETSRNEILARITFRRFTTETITNRMALEKAIAETIQRGWSEDHMESDPFTTCCGAPVFDHLGQPIAAISVAGVTERIRPMLPKIGPLVASTAEAISRNLGYDPAINYSNDRLATDKRLDYRARP